MGMKLPKRQTILESQFKEYMDYAEYTKRFTDTTIRSKRQIIRMFITQHPRLTDFRKLTNEELDAWTQGLVKQGKTGKTVNNYCDQITALLRYFQNKRGKKLRLRLEAVERCEEDPPLAPHFSVTQIERIKQKCQGLRELVLISLIFDSGLRISEVKKLKANNIKGNEIIIVGKKRKERSVFMTGETKGLLDRWILLAGVGEEGYVFPSPMNFDSPLSVLQIRSSINAPIRRAGYEEGSAHAVRRGAVTDWLDSGIELQDAAKLAGHSDPMTTQRHYYRVSNKVLGARYAQAKAGATV